MSNDSGFGFGDIIDAVGSAISDAAGAIFQAIADAVAFLFQAISFTWQVLLGNLEFQNSAWDRVKGFFSAIWNQGILAFLGKLWTELKKIKDLLRRIFDPILCVIKAIIDYHDFLFNKYLRPVLILIQRLRSVLTLLRLLHVKWAARLDARLVAIESQLAGLFLGVRRELNSIRGTISLILDPFGLFDQARLLVSNLRSIPELWAAIKGVGERPLTASESQQVTTNGHYATVAYRQEQVSAAVNGQPTDFQEETNFRLAYLNAAIAGQGLPEDPGQQLP